MRNKPDIHASKVGEQHYSSGWNQNGVAGRDITLHIKIKNNTEEIHVCCYFFGGGCCLGPTPRLFTERRRARCQPCLRLWSDAPVPKQKSAITAPHFEGLWCPLWSPWQPGTHLGMKRPLMPPAETRRSIQSCRITVADLWRCWQLS